MKYLKKYNESNNNKLLELQEFCNSYLAYLIDDGFKIKYNYNNVLFINIEKNNELNRINSIKELNDNFIKGLFKWNDIKYDFIPFYENLLQKYNIMEIYLLCDTRIIINSKVDITINDILEDKINEKIDNTLIHNIIIKIK